MTTEDPKFKLVVIGEAGVGKTCLILQYADKVFTEKFISTIGADFKFKDEIIEGKKIRVEVWDTAGQERFRTITSSYYKGAAGVLLVYDLATRTSFDRLSTWLDEIDSFADSVDPRKKHIIALVANKTDLDPRVVTEDEGKKFASDHNMLYFETSAKDNVSTSHAIRSVAEEIFKQQGLVSRQPAPGTIIVDPAPAPKAKGCCS